MSTFLIIGHSSGIGKKPAEQLDDSGSVCMPLSSKADLQTVLTYQNTKVTFPTGIKL
jgi:short-subunit dehydrogenase